MGGAVVLPGPRLVLPTLDDIRRYVWGANLGAGSSAPVPWNTSIAADTPYAWFKLDETSGTNAFDSSGNTRTSTYLNTPTLNQTGVAAIGNAAVTFNGTDELVDVNAAVGTIATTASTTVAETWAIELVAKPSSTAANNSYLVSLGNTADTDPIIGMTILTGVAGSRTLSSAYRLDDGVGIITPGITGAIDDGNWHHLVMECDGSFVTLYRDGTANTPTAVPTGATATFNTGGVAALRRNVASSWSVCTIDEAVFYDHALGAARVTAHYNSFLGV